MESMVLNAWFYKQMAIWSRLLNRTDMALEYWRKVSALRPQDAAPIASIAFLEAQRGVIAQRRSRRSSRRWR
jgi:hypothetical protein